MKLLDHFFMNLPTLETERVILRKLKSTDKDAIFEYSQNPNVARHVLWNTHESILDTLEFLNKIFEAYNKNKPASWGICLKNNPDKVIGTVGFVNIDKEKRTGEIGYVLSEEHWGKGLMPEIISKIVNFCKRELNLNEIYARVINENLASIRVLEKCGFTFWKEDTMEIKGKLKEISFYVNSTN